LKPGDIFSIPTGPFKGTEGIVKELDKNRIQLLLVGLGFKITFTQLQGRYIVLEIKKSSLVGCIL